VTQAALLLINTPIYSDGKYNRPYSYENNGNQNLVNEVFSLPALNSGVFLQIGVPIFVIGTHEEGERVVDYGWLPQQHDHKKGCH
jgi:hypothetical protein